MRPPPVYFTERTKQISLHKYKAIGHLPNGRCPMHYTFIQVNGWGQLTK